MNVELAKMNQEKIRPQMSIAEEDAYISDLRSDPERAKEVYKQNVRAFIEEEVNAGATLQELRRIHAGRSLLNGPAAEQLELSRKALSGLYDSEERTRISETAFEDVLNELQNSRGEELAETVRQHVFSNHLGYQDAAISPEDKKNAVDFVKESESAKKYADALIETTRNRNISEYEAAARQMVEECDATLLRLGITPTPYAASKTWGMWDIGKQYHFLLHPAEADPKYRIADPIEDSAKRQEIVDRHVGWEAYGAWRYGDKAFIENVPQTTRAAATEYLNREPKNAGTLSSKELAELGALLRI